MIKKQEFLYLMGVVLAITRTYIDNSNLAKVFELYDIILLPLIIFAFFWKIIESKYKKNEMILICIIFCVCALAAITNSKFVILMTFVALISLKNVDVDKVIKTIFITNCFFLLFYTFVYFLKINLFPDTVKFIFFNNGKIRHAFFFNHPNFYSGIMFWTLAEYLYLKKDKANFINYITVIVIGFLAGYFTQTRTLLICIIILIMFCYMFNKNRKIFLLFLEKFVKYGFAIFSVVVIIIVSNFFELYSLFPNAIEKIDKILSRRVSLSAMVSQQYDFSFLPQKVNYNQTYSWQNKYESNLILDNIYVQCSVIHGWCFLVLISLLFYYGTQNIKNKRIYIFCAMMIITGIVESYILNCYICFPVLLMASNLLNKENGDENG